MLPGAGAQPGYYSKLLTECGLLLPYKSENVRHNGFVLNEIVTRLSNWQSVLHVFRDLRHCTDNVSAATVMHRLAKLSDRAHVRNPSPPFVAQALRFHKILPSISVCLTWKVAYLLSPNVPFYWPKMVQSKSQLPAS